MKGRQASTQRRPARGARAGRSGGSSSAELLFEIGTEELPAQFVSPALAELADRAGRLFKEARLRHDSVASVGTPRRLTLVVKGLAQTQESSDTQVMGPSKAVAFDAHGKPTKAALGFAAGQGVAVDSLEVRTTSKGEYVYAVKREGAHKTAALLPELLNRLVSSVSFPKAMRWNDSDARFARPVRWLVALNAGKPVRLEFAGVKAGDWTLSHRFLSPARRLRVHDFKSYLKNLEQAGVIVDQDRRRTMIVAQLERLARQKGGVLIQDTFLVEQAVYSVEMPYAIIGSFQPQFLDLPKDVLITAMKEHQGYFSLLRPQGGLLPFFLTVTNMGSRQAATVRSGNERVLAARLADARFFYNEDRKMRLDSRVSQLKGVTFHQKLGTLHQKVDRLVTLAPALAYTLAAQAAADTCRQAAKLCKADLTTGMVGEFPTLQGIMGREYALHDGEPEPVAAAIAEHYLPKFAEDVVPPSLPGKILSVADRLDTLSAFFAVDLIPSGSQDPYALRRHALAVIRILIEGQLSLDLGAALKGALDQLKGQGIAVAEKAAGELERFLAERLRYYVREVAKDLKVRDDLLEAVLSVQTFDPLRIVTLAEALQQLGVRAGGDFQALIVAGKRVENISRKHHEDQVDLAALMEPAEKDLLAAAESAEAHVSKMIQAGELTAALRVLARLKDPIDAFFNAVMVMVEDASVRKNRLGLLVRVRNLFRQYADFSKIPDELSPGIDGR